MIKDITPKTSIFEQFRSSSWTKLLIYAFLLVASGAAILLALPCRRTPASLLYGMHGISMKSLYTARPFDVVLQAVASRENYRLCLLCLQKKRQVHKQWIGTSGTKWPVLFVVSACSNKTRFADKALFPVSVSSWTVLWAFLKSLPRSTRLRKHSRRKASKTASLLG